MLTFSGSASGPVRRRSPVSRPRRFPAPRPRRACSPRACAGRRGSSAASTRRARATAIALSPAVVFALAALRSGDPRSPIAADDPPSLTFRLDPATLEAAERPARWGASVRRRRPRPPSPGRERCGAAAARATATPRIDWHHATSLGLPWSGSLVDGTQLPVEGPNWVTWDPRHRQRPERAEAAVRQPAHHPRDRLGDRTRTAPPIRGRLASSSATSAARAAGR